MGPRAPSIHGNESGRQAADGWTGRPSGAVMASRNTAVQAGLKTGRSPLTGARRAAGTTSSRRHRRFARPAPTCGNRNGVTQLILLLEAVPPNGASVGGPGRHRALRPQLRPRQAPPPRLRPRHGASDRPTCTEHGSRLGSRRSGPACWRGLGRPARPRRVGQVVNFERHPIGAPTTSTSSRREF